MHYILVFDYQIEQPCFHIDRSAAPAMLRPSVVSYKMRWFRGRSITYVIQFHILGFSCIYFVMLHFNRNIIGWCLIFNLSAVDSTLAMFFFICLIFYALFCLLGLFAMSWFSYDLVWLGVEYA